MGTPDAETEIGRMRRKFQILADKDDGPDASLLSSPPGRPPQFASTPGADDTEGGQLVDWYTEVGTANVMEDSLYPPPREDNYEDMMLRQTFDIYSGGKEEITPNDFATIIMDESITGASNHKGYSSTFIKFLMDELDTDKNGRIEFDEFVEAFNGIQFQSNMLQAEGFTGAYLRSFEKETAKLHDDVIALKEERKLRGRQYDKDITIKDEENRILNDALEQQRLEFNEEKREMLSSRRGYVSGEEHAQLQAEHASTEAARAAMEKELTGLKSAIMCFNDLETLDQFDIKSTQPAEEVVGHMWAELQRFQGENGDLHVQVDTCTFELSDVVDKMALQAKQLDQYQVDMQASQRHLYVFLRASYLQTAIRHSLGRMLG